MLLRTRSVYWEEFDWDNDNIGHIAEHGVEAWEVEEAFSDYDRIEEAYNVPGERRWAFIEATEVGRILFVVYTHRRGKIRIVTARSAEDREKRKYRRRG